MTNELDASRVVLVDRDGVLNRDRPEYVLSPDELEVFPAALIAIQRLHAAGFKIVVITNQAGVGKGLVTPTALDAIHHKLRQAL